MRAACRIGAGLLFLAVLACGGGAGTTGGGTTATTGGGSGGTNATPGALLTTAYFHVADSDGSKAGTDAEVVLAFEPDGVAQVIAANLDDFLAYRGTYEVTATGTHLKFTDPDFQHEATVVLDPSQATATLPFPVFAKAAGATSTWERRTVTVTHNVGLILRAAMMYEGLTPTAAKARAVAYANAVIARDAAAPTGHATGRPASKFLGWFSGPEPKLVGVRDAGPGQLDLQYEGGGWTRQQLYGWAQGSFTPLTMGPLAGDPRSHLDVKSPGIPTADPLRRTALVVAPLRHLKAFAWYDHPAWERIFNYSGSCPSGAAVGSCAPKTSGYHFAGSEGFDFDAVRASLEGAGYAVTQLDDDAATPLAIARALLPGGGAPAPGFIVVNTHGLPDGLLATAVILGNEEGGKTKEITSWQSIKQGLKDAGYGDLLTYGGGTEDAPVTLDTMRVDRDMRPGSTDYFLSLTPKFWEWARSRGADFGRSLVYIASCHTDHTPDLRNAIRSRAYFAFNVPARPQVAGAIFNYLGKTLARPTRSAEEAYYNIIRVANTRQMIYAEDKLFDGFTDALVQNQAIGLQKEFKGYAASGGTEPIGYDGAGWLADSNPGGVWYMLWAGRWTTTAAAGAQSLLDCWTNYWSKGSTGGLANVWCQNANPGGVPKEASLTYSYYLLTGAAAPGLAAVPLVPRFTLHDGDAPAP